MSKVVIDTNVIVSTFISKIGKPAKILNLCFENKLYICYTCEILQEYEEVLSRQHFNFKIININDLLDTIKETGILIENIKSSEINMPDESDRIFYDTAKESGAILITGNKKHYPDEPFILTPAEFLENLTNETVS